MKAKHWPVVIGASILSLAAGFLANKKQENICVKEGLKQYIGHWSYTSGVRKTKHHITINPEFEIAIDGHQVKGNLKELSIHNLVWQDEFGYHLKFITDGNKPVKLYDEADDETYNLEKTIKE